MAYTAFVSSTFEDLKDHRREVIASLRKAGILVDPMEDWTAARDEPKKFSQDRIRDCDLCVLLVGFRRGHVPKGEKSSITQLEYQAALDMGIDVLVFMLADDSPWRGKFDELEKDPEITRWRAELKEVTGVGFFGLQPSSIEIAPALTRWIAERQQSALSQGVPRPATVPWSPKTVRIGGKCGILENVNGKIEFTRNVAESLQANGKDWVLGRPLGGSDRVLADWTEYSAMSIVVATNPGTVLATELQDDLYMECQHQLIGQLLQLAIEADVMHEEEGQLSVADDLNEEMMENFRHLDSLDYLDEADGDPRTAAVLAFIDMVRARLLLHVSDKADYAEALATLILSSFGFWEGPELAAVSSKSRSKRRPSGQSKRSGPGKSTKTKAAGQKAKRKTGRKTK